MSTIFGLTNDEVFLVTTSYKGQDNGMIATWLMPASLVSECPRVVAVLSPENLTTELIRKSGHFIAHLLSGKQADLVPTFGLYSGRDIDKFENIKFDRLNNGLPVLSGTCGWMECKIAKDFDCGDRIVFICDVISHKLNAERRPLRMDQLDSSLPDEIKCKMKDKHISDSHRDLSLFKKIT